MSWWYVVLPACVMWVCVLVAPWRPWATEESLDAQGGDEDVDLSDVTVLVPARDEAAQIGTTLAGLGRQGRGFRIILIDDQSTDGTAAVARACRIEGLEIVHGTPLPPRWSGKLWALHQGLAHVRTERVLLLDADVELLPGILPALRATLRDEGCQLVSLLVSLRMDNVWERFLMPAFVYFFKLLYPFRLSNSPAIPFVACAAGGCILLETRALREIGGFDAIRDALIDDCALAGCVKKRGFRTWIGLTHSARSLRPYPTLSSIWDMVARTAFTQLRYSPALLALCTLVMLCAFAAPVAALCSGEWPVAAVGALTLAMAMVSYRAVLRYYGLSLAWVLGLPGAGCLFLGMTWSSAIRYWRGRRSLWKGRHYGTDEALAGALEDTPG
ncbi:MAG: glycosyltransferase [Gammaproteobacteria bacterium]